MQSVFSAALDDSQLGTLTALFPGSRLSSEDIKLEGTFVFYKWLLTGISIPEWKRLLKKDAKASSENSSVQNDEQVGRSKKRAFNIQLYGNRTHNFVGDKSEEVELPQGIDFIFFVLHFQHILMINVNNLGFSEEMETKKNKTTKRGNNAINWSSRRSNNKAEIAVEQDGGAANDGVAGNF